MHTCMLDEEEYYRTSSNTLTSHAISTIINDSPTYAQIYTTVNKNKVYLKMGRRMMVPVNSNFTGNNKKAIEWGKNALLRCHTTFTLPLQSAG